MKQIADTINQSMHSSEKLSRVYQVMCELGGEYEVCCCCDTIISGTWAMCANQYVFVTSPLGSIGTTSAIHYGEQDESIDGMMNWLTCTNKPTNLC
jgi:hypothetical protein